MFKWRRKRKILLIAVSIIATIILTLVGIITYQSCSRFGKSGTQMEKEYLSDKEYFDKGFEYSFGQENKGELIFLSKKSLSKKQYNDSKEYYQLPDYEEVCIFELDDKSIVIDKNNGGLVQKHKYAFIVFKGDVINLLKMHDFCNKSHYVKYEDYCVLDDECAYFLLGDISYNEEGIATTMGGKVLLDVKAECYQNGIFEIPLEVTHISNAPFKKSSKIKHVKCSPNMIRIGQLTFYHSSLENISLNDGLVAIVAQAFQGCKNLKQIVIPKSVEIIGAKAFTDTMVFCEAESKPNGWEDDFAVENAKVYYANEWHYDDAGNPVPNS